MQNRQAQQRKRKQLNDLQEFFADVLPYYAQPKWQSPYTPLDAYREFNEVFGSDSGKRVLAQIIHWCEGLPITFNQMESHAYLCARQGMREIGQQIVKMMNAVPEDRGHDE